MRPLPFFPYPRLRTAYCRWFATEAENARGGIWDFLPAARRSRLPAGAASGSGGGG